MRSITASLLTAVMLFMTACTENQVKESINIGIAVGTQLVNLFTGLSGADAQAQPIIDSGMSEANKDLNDMLSAYDQWKAVPADQKATYANKIVTIGNLVQNNLATLLADAHVKNSSKLSDVNDAVAVINSVVDSILQAIPASSTTIRRKVVDLPTVPGAKKAKDLQKFWNQKHPDHKV